MEKHTTETINKVREMLENGASCQEVAELLNIPYQTVYYHSRRVVNRCCKKCGSPIRGGDKFCHECGARIMTDAQVCAEKLLAARASAIAGMPSSEKAELDEAIRNAVNELRKH